MGIWWLPNRRRGSRNLPKLHFYRYYLNCSWIERPSTNRTQPKTPRLAGLLMLIGGGFFYARCIPPGPAKWSIDRTVRGQEILLITIANVRSPQLRYVSVCYRIVLLCGGLLLSCCYTAFFCCCCCGVSLLTGSG